MKNKKRISIIKTAVLSLSILFSLSAQEKLLNKTTIQNNKTRYITKVPAGVLSGQFLKAKSPYLLEGSVIIPSGHTLTIQPGVIILIAGDYSSITVFGQILARGTKKQPITFKSAKKKPNPWDWDRIMLRSRYRSFLQYCNIKNSNYGIYAVNAAVTLKKCTFRRNSIHGLYARNSKISVQECVFNKGHVAAVMLDRGADVNIEQTTIKENINGIVCADFARMQVKNSNISKNNVGIAVKKQAGVSLVDTKITGNKIGILSETKLPKKSLSNINDNFANIVVSDSVQMEKVFKKPAEFSTLTFARNKGKEKNKYKINSGFISRQSSHYSFVKIVGNATLEFKYFRPTDFEHPTDTVMTVTTTIKGSDTLADTTIAKKFYSQNRYIQGFQPELQLFSTGRKYGWDINLLVDSYRNTWLSGTNLGGIKANLLNFRMNSKNNTIVLGDFFQSGSDISVSNRKVFGAKYQGQFGNTGRGNKRFTLTTLTGETERPLAQGDHNPDVANDTIQDGFAVRQQIMSMGRLSVKIINGLTVGVHAIHSRDLQNSILRKTLKTNEKTSNKPIESIMEGLDLQYRFYKDKLIARIEGGAGYADSLDTLSFEKLQKPSDFTYKDAAAGSFGFGAELGKTIAELQITTVRPRYFTGGNPYLTQDQHSGHIGITTRFTESINAGIDHEITIRNASYTMAANQSEPPMQNRTSLNSRFKAGKNSPELSLNYTFYDERYKKFDVVTLSNPDTIITINAEGDTNTTIRTDTSGQYKINTVKHIAGLNIKQPFVFLKSSYVRLGYRIQSETDKSGYLDSKDLGKRNSLQHQISGMLSARYARRVTDRLSAKYKLRNEKKNNRNVDGYEIRNRLIVDVFPRKLKLTMEGRYRKDINTEDIENNNGNTTQTTTVGWSRTALGELKYTVSSKISASFIGNYEKNYDETEGSSDNYKVIFGGVSFTYVF